MKVFYKTTLLLIKQVNEINDTCFRESAWAVGFRCDIKENKKAFAQSYQICGVPCSIVCEKAGKISFVQVVIKIKNEEQGRGKEN